MKHALKLKSLNIVPLLPFIATGPALAKELPVLHVGGQKSWLISAQGNLRDNTGQGISFYGGIDRLATLKGLTAGQFVPARDFILQ
ncbi:MAG: hypothetical protein WA112_10310 [Rugosibacter sp.]|jgi:hypothetical protein|nr:hypothetical protein [Rugosibacter sp.]